CTRRELAIRARRAPAGTLYPGTCRDGPLHPERPLALRVRVPDAELGFVDRAFGACRANLATRHGDFVVRRADGLYAYHLAVVVDDAEQGITEVVRGADLLEQTLPQLLLQRLLGLPVPGYLHLPLAVDGAGHKLSKQTGALPLPAGDPRPALLAVLQHLGQAPPAGLRAESLDGLWHWAVRHWDPAALPTAPAPLRAPSAPAR
ncbi:MAG TPA: glutamate--tRNA ligase family protein, partial [Gammaproteobacteria bacterium]